MHAEPGERRNGGTPRRRSRPPGVVTGIMAVVLTGLALLAGACTSSGTAVSTASTAAGSSNSALPATTPGTGSGSPPGTRQPAGAASTKAAAASAGCGPARVAGTTHESVTSGGKDRTYLLTVPNGYDGRDPRPLVFDFHGLGATAEVEAAYSKLAEHGASRAYITITPNSDAGSGGTMWLAPPVPKNDMAFVEDLYAHTIASLCVDTNRVYVAGISNGAMLTGALSCDMAGRLAGAAMVAGPNAWKPCPGQPPVALVGFHGTDDPLVPYGGGTMFSGLDDDGNDAAGQTPGGGVGAAAGDAGRGSRRAPSRPGGGGGGVGGGGTGGGVLSNIKVASVPDALAGWAQRNGCSVGPARATVAADVTSLTYSGCTAGADTMLYTIEGGGHTWPGAAATPTSALGSTTQSIDASALMLDFFDAHAR